MLFGKNKEIRSLVNENVSLRARISALETEWDTERMLYGKKMRKKLIHDKAKRLTDDTTRVYQNSHFSHTFVNIDRDLAKDIQVRVKAHYVNVGVNASVTFYRIRRDYRFDVKILGLIKEEK